MKNLEQFIELRNAGHMAAFLQKLDKKQPVSICFLGGSITSGFKIDEKHCFVNLFKQWLDETYPENSITIYNLAIAGTPSIFGLYQCLQYLGHYDPDLVFIEYAINDMKNDEHQSAFESLVYSCLSMKKNPGVVLLLAKSQVGYTCQNYMDMVAEHYNQPSIFVGKAVDTIAWEDYSDDYGHPNQKGHRLISDLIITLFTMAKTTAKEIKVPASYQLPDKAFYNNDLSQFVFQNKIWEYRGDGKNISVQFCETCRYLYLLYYSSIEDCYGDTELLIDGQKLETLSGYRINNWDHLMGHIVFLSDKPKKHSICLKMQTGEEDKFFSLQNIGFC